jgi:endogenous inhibitor of DNA gyrase (YacG/DUF329 family)
MSEPEKPVPRCPICGKPRAIEFRPFCSRLCRDRDLLSWLDGRYAVPAVEVDEDGSEGDPNERG